MAHTSGVLVIYMMILSSKCFLFYTYNHFSDSNQFANCGDLSYLIPILSKLTAPIARKKEVFRLNYKVGDKFIDVLETPDHFGRLKLPPHVTGINFIYSCNGLVSLSNYDCNVIYLWNPSMRRIKLLPAPTKLLSDRQVNLGFGFDSVSNDYKLLRIGFKENTDVIYSPEAELYSANADSWKEIHVCKTLESFWPIPSNFVHANSGVLYFQSLSDLLAFDLHNEVFRLYPFPDVLKSHRRSNIFDDQGCIAVISVVGDGSVLSLFKLDNVCGKMCWTKMFNLEGDLKRVFWYRYLGLEHIFTRKQDGRYVYKTRYKQRRKKKLYDRLIEIRRIIEHSESLVTLDKFEEESRGK